MVADQQVRRLMSLIQNERSLAATAANSGMDEKTARVHRRLGKLPSDVSRPHTWRTREDPLAAVWPAVCELLWANLGLEAKTVFTYLQREC
jgi:hypothetical protein